MDVKYENNGMVLENLFNINIIVLTLPESKRYEKINTFMKKNKINFYRIFGINKNNIENYKSKIGKFCEYFCTDSMIGCGLAHLNIFNELNTNSYFENDLTLIIEDDTFVNFSELNKILPNLIEFTKNKDNLGIIQLSGMNLIKKETLTLTEDYVLSNYFLHGSLSAYLITKKTARYFYDTIQINYHIDFLLSFTPYKNFLLEPNLAYQLGKYDSSMINRGKIMDKRYELFFPIIKIPYLNFNVNFSLIILILIIVLFVCLKIESIIFLFFGVLFLEII